MACGPRVALTFVAVDKLAIGGVGIPASEHPQGLSLWALGLQRLWVPPWALLLSLMPGWNAALEDNETRLLRASA